MGISSAMGSQALVPAGFGFRNLIINGDMRIAQRGTSSSSIYPPTNSSTAQITYNTADRWGFLVAQNFNAALGVWQNIGGFSQSVENDAPSGFAKSLKMNNGVATSNISGLGGAFAAVTQRIEGQNLAVLGKGTSEAKQAYISFWVKSNVTGTYICELLDVDNSRSVSLSYSVSSSGVWEKKTLLVPADTTGSFVYDNSSGLEVVFFLAAGPNLTSGSLQTSWGSTTTANRAVGQVNLASANNNYWQVTGVQLEQNNVPTNFENRPIGLELALCQRYYERTWRSMHIGMGVNENGTVATFVNIPIYPKRSSTLTVTSTGSLFQHWGGTGGTYAGYDYETPELFMWVKYTSAPLSANAVGMMYLNNGYIDVSAEL